MKNEIMMDFKRKLTAVLFLAIVGIFATEQAKAEVIWEGQGDLSEGKYLVHYHIYEPGYSYSLQVEHISGTAVETLVMSKLGFTCFEDNPKANARYACDYGVDELLSTENIRSLHVTNYVQPAFGFWDTYQAFAGAAVANKLVNGHSNFPVTIRDIRVDESSAIALGGEGYVQFNGKDYMKSGQIYFVIIAKHIQDMRATRATIRYKLVRKEL